MALRDPPPRFTGYPGEKSLGAFFYELDAWISREFMVQPDATCHLIYNSLQLAFPYDTPAQWWWEANRDVLKQGTHPNDPAIFNRLKDALNQEYKGLQEDPVSALHNTHYHPGEQDLGEHIHKFVKHFKRSQLTDKYGCDLFVKSLAADRALQLAIEQQFQRPLLEGTCTVNDISAFASNTAKLLRLHSANPKPPLPKQRQFSHADVACPVHPSSNHSAAECTDIQQLRERKTTARSRTSPSQAHTTAFMPSTPSNAEQRLQMQVEQQSMQMQDMQSQLNQLKLQQSPRPVQPPMPPPWRPSASASSSKSKPYWPSSSYAGPHPYCSICRIHHPDPCDQAWTSGSAPPTPPTSFNTPNYGRGRGFPPPPAAPFSPAAPGAASSMARPPGPAAGAYTPRPRPPSPASNTPSLPRAHATTKAHALKSIAEDPSRETACATAAHKEMLHAHCTAEEPLSEPDMGASFADVQQEPGHEYTLESDDDDDAFLPLPPIQLHNSSTAFPNVHANRRPPLPFSAPPWPPTQPPPTPPSHTTSPSHTPPSTSTDDQATLHLPLNHLPQPHPHLPQLQPGSKAWLTVTTPHLEQLRALIKERRQGTAQSAAPTAHHTSHGSDFEPRVQEQTPTVATLHHTTEATPLFLLYKGNPIRPTKALLDPCADIGLISAEFAQQRGIHYRPTKAVFNASGGIVHQPLGEVDSPITAELWPILQWPVVPVCHPKLNSAASNPTTFYVVDQVSPGIHVLLPTGVLFDWGAMVDPLHNLLLFRPQQHPHRWASVPVCANVPISVANAAGPSSHTTPAVRETLPEVTVDMTLPHGVTTQPHETRFTREPTTGAYLGNHPHISNSQSDRLQATLRQHKGVFAHDLSSMPGYRGTAGPFTIPLIHSNSIIAKKRPKSAQDVDIINEKCSAMEQAGIVKPAPPFTQYASEVTLPAKKDEHGNVVDKRLCVDYRPLNAASVPDFYGMHTPDELFRHVAGARYFSKIDMRAGYHQIPVHHSDIQKTSFWWLNRLYSYQRMPFGAKNASAHFQRVMDTEIIRSGLTHCCQSFVDDMLVFSDTAEQHISHVDAALHMIHNCGLRAHPEKSYFCADSVEFLGHLVSPHGLSPEQAKVATILKLPHPTDLKDLQSKMGQIGYYRGFVPNFSAIAHPINRLTTKGTAFHWGLEQAAAFEQLKAAIGRPGLVLRAPDPSRPYYLHTDFSLRGLGAVLSQKDDTGREYMVACISRSLNTHERNYDAYKGEALAAVWAIRTFHIYLHGRFFYLVTDHRPLTNLMTNNDLGGQHARWALMLQPYTFHIIHRPGVTNQNADIASRYPLPSTEDPTGARMDPDDSDTPPTIPSVHVTSARLQPPAPTACYPSTALGTPQFLRVNDQPLDDPFCFYFQSTPTGEEDTAITLYEPFGGICSGLEAALWAGMRVHRYVYSDPDPAAQAAARSRMHFLHTVHPAYFPRTASTHAFDTLPHDVDQITDRQLWREFASDPNPVLIIAGWECQDLSPAGPNTGLQGARSSTFYSLLQLVATIQHYRTGPTGYILENVATAHHPNPFISQQQHGIICAALGIPTTSDAAACGAAAHRLRHLWTNLAPAASLQHTLTAHYPTSSAYSRPPASTAQHNLDPGRRVQICTRVNPPPYAQCNIVGQPVQVLPTIVSHPYSYNFREGRQGAILNADGRLTQPNPDERERLLGFHMGPHSLMPDCTPRLTPGSTAAPGLSLAQRHALTGRAMSPLQLYHLIHCVFILRRSTFNSSPASSSPPPLAHPQSGGGHQGDMPSASHTTQIDGALASDPTRVVLDEDAHTDTEDADFELTYSQPDSEDEMHIPTIRAVQRQRSRPYERGRLDPSGNPEEPEYAAEPPTSMAENDQAELEADDEIQHLDRTADIYADKPTMKYLLHQQLPFRESERRRVLRRAAYNFVGTDGQLKHRASNGAVKTIPPPELRAQLVAEWHERSCHFGVERTLSLLTPHYWWRGMADDVRRVLRNCAVCDRANAPFNARPAQLQPLPVDGVFFRWNVDLAGPVHTSSATGSQYILIAIEHMSKWLVAVPIPDKSADTVSRAFIQHVIGVYGSSAQVLTDQGSEFQGLFAQMCFNLRIDHRQTSPNSPQSDGLAERAVQTVKQALRKCLAANPHELWDTKLPWICLAYNCSTQHATRLTPYEIIFARKPIIPPAASEAFTPTVRLDNEDDLTRVCRERAAAAEHNSLIAGGNIKISQHRDVLWYARLRGGGYTPQMLEFKEGDFIYLKSRSQAHALQMEALPAIYKVLFVTPNGAVKLQGKDGRTMVANVRNCAPCDLTGIDPAIDPTLARPDQDLACEVCRFPSNEESMLLCDACGNGYHTFCLQPPLHSIPPGAWICPVCIAEQVTLPHLHEVQVAERAREARRPRAAEQAEPAARAPARRGRPPGRSRGRARANA